MKDFWKSAACPVVIYLMPLLRYPGAKTRLVKQLRDYMPGMSGVRHYAEPFIGAGSVFEALAQDMLPGAEILLSDADEDLVALWRVTLHGDLAGLLSRCDAWKPSTEAFYAMREQSGGDDLERAFRKLALHQTSFSGLGVMGGPIGGRAQTSKYDVGCRWSPTTTRKNLTKLRRVAARHSVEVRCQDFETTLAWISGKSAGNSFCYLDPPYYAKGDQCYFKSMSDADHDRLAKCLAELECLWSLSYDDAPRVRELYQECWISEPLAVKYSISGERVDNVAADGEQGDIVISAREPSTRTSADYDKLIELARASARKKVSSCAELPRLLERILERDDWKRRTSRKGTVVEFSTFDEFAIHKLGLAVPADKVREIVEVHGASAKVHTALANRAGAPNGNRNAAKDKENNNSDNIRIDLPRGKTLGDIGGTSREYTVARLERDRPDLAARVESGEMSANAAAREAGFRKAQKDKNPILVCANRWERASARQREAWLREQKDNAESLAIAWSVTC